MKPLNRFVADIRKAKHRRKYAEDLRDKNAGLTKVDRELRARGKRAAYKNVTLPKINLPTEAENA